MGGFLATVDQYVIAYHVTGLFGVLLILECAFLPETLFPRTIVVTTEQSISSSEEGDRLSEDSLNLIKRTKQLGFLVNSADRAR